MVLQDEHPFASLPQLIRRFFTEKLPGTLRELYQRGYVRASFVCGLDGPWRTLVLHLSCKVNRLSWRDPVLTCFTVTYMERDLLRDQIEKELPIHGITNMIFFQQS